jgi:hypothetical protein
MATGSTILPVVAMCNLSQKTKPDMFVYYFFVTFKLSPDKKNQLFELQHLLHVNILFISSIT